MALLFANNNSLSAITTKPSGLSGGAMNLISTQTASSSSTISFTSELDSTYKEYIFKFIDIHPSVTDGILQFNGSDDTSSHSYNITKTTTYFYADHFEDDSETNLNYLASYDLAQSTDFQGITQGAINDNNDDCAAGTLHLFNPSSTTFVKHFMARTNWSSSNPYSRDGYLAGYFNTTSAITAIQFKMNSGTIQAGTIKLYGIS